MAKHPRRLETGALTVWLWLLAVAIAPAAQSIDYLPAVGAAPLLFQPPAATGRPAGWPPLLRPDDRGTNASTQATSSGAPTGEAATDQSVLPPPVAVDSLVPDSPPITADAPTPAPPPDPSLLSLPPLTDPRSAASPVVDMASVLRWLAPALINAPDGSLMSPAFVPATPPLSSTAVYESR